MIAGARALRPGAWIALGAFVVLVALTFKPVIENDGIGYFSYLHTLVVDHDLDFTNEYLAVRTEHVGYYPLLITSRTATGMLADYFPIGAAIISSPVYLLTVALHGSAGPQFGPPLSVTLTLVSLLVGLIALAISYRLASEVAGTGAALAGVVGAAAATPFAYYLLYEPSYSHTFSACAVAGFVYVWLRGRDRRGAAGWLVLGLLGGLMGLIRYQDGPLLLIGLLDRPRRWWHIALFAAGVVIAFAPQLPVDRALFGTLLPARPAGQDLQFLPGHYLDVLFSSFHGLFSWSPVLVLAVAGFVFVPDRRLQLAFVYAFLLELALGGAAPDWFGGFAFGQRRFVSLTPFFAIGLAALARRVDIRAAWAAIVAFIAWNLLLIANFTYVIKTSGDPGYGQILRGQLRAVAFLPHLVSQGAAGRALVLWPALHLRFDPLYGLAVLLGEIVCVAVAFVVFRRLPAPTANVNATNVQNSRLRSFFQ